MWMSAGKELVVGASVTIPLAASDVVVLLVLTCLQMDAPVLVCCILAEIKFTNEQIFFNIPIFFLK